MTQSHVDPALKTYGTERQGEYIDAVNLHGSNVAAAKALGIAESVVRGAIHRLKAQAAMRGYAPEFGYKSPVPVTHVAKGVSQLTDADGKVKLTWVKSSLNEQMLQAAIQAAADACADELPRLAALPPPVATNDKLLTVYTMTDCHVGMLAWGKETGQPWDLSIAERVLTGCFEQMVAGSPPSSVAYVNQLGDFMHTDGMKSVTPEHGHLLDSDGRFPKMVRVAVRILRRLVDLALAKHDKVVLLLAEGNHDMASSIWLRAMFAALYENEPRVQVVESEYPYYAHQHGETMVAFHHGHLMKPDQMPLHFATTFPAMWGTTKHRYAHCGHRHHTEEKEHSGMTVHQHTTLSAKDAYAARGGWHSDRSATAVTYHNKFGKRSTVTVTPEELDELEAS